MTPWLPLQAPKPCQSWRRPIDMTFLDQIKTERRWEFLLLSGVLFFFKANKKNWSFFCVFAVVERWQNSENAASPLKWHSHYYKWVVRSKKSIFPGWCHVKSSISLAIIKSSLSATSIYVLWESKGVPPPPNGHLKPQEIDSLRNGTINHHDSFIFPFHSALFLGSSSGGYPYTP